METDTKNRPAQKAFRLSDDGRELLAGLARALGLNETGVIELALRDLARDRGVKLAGSVEHDPE